MLVPRYLKAIEYKKVKGLKFGATLTLSNFIRLFCLLRVVKRSGLFHLLFSLVNVHLVYNPFIRNADDSKVAKLI